MQQQLPVAVAEGLALRVVRGTQVCRRPRAARAAPPHQRRQRFNEVVRLVLQVYELPAPSRVVLLMVDKEEGAFTFVRSERHHRQAGGT